MSTKIFESIHILTLVACVFLLGCNDKLSGCRHIDGSNGYRQIQQISEISNIAKIQKLNSFSIPEQIDIYLYSKQCIGEGGNPRIGPYFYLNGEKKIPAIVERIKAVDEVSDKVYLLDALFYINEKCECINKSSSTFEDLVAISMVVNADPQISKDDLEIFNLRFDSLHKQASRITDQQSDHSQLRFGMEYDIKRKATLPAAIWKNIVNGEENDSTREAILSRNDPELWVDSSVIDLNRDGLSDYVVVAKGGNWLGANSTTCWVFLDEGDNYRNVLKTSALQIEFSNEMKNGFRTISTAVLSAKSFNETIYAYNGKLYKPLSFKHGSLK